MERDDVAPKHKAKISIPVAPLRRDLRCAPKSYTGYYENFVPGLTARSTALALLKRILI